MTNGALAYAGSAVKTNECARFARIAFITDFSNISLKALSWAGAIARAFGSELQLLYALTPGDYICAVPEFDSSVIGLIEQDAKARLVALKDSPELQGVKHVATRVCIGGLITLYNQIDEEDADLIVMATHGRKGLRHLLLGSVAEDVVHTAACPVVTIGPELELKNRSEFRPKHILFATDASADSFRALPLAILFAMKQSSSLALVHVLSKGQEGTPEAEAFAALMRDALHRALPLTAIKNCSPEILVKFGNPTEEILKAARERGSELIVMGARSSANRSTFSRSVSYGVIAQAPCPVLTVRGRK